MNAPAAATPQDPQALMRSIIQRVATGPEMSKDISEDEARGGMRLVLEQAVDPVQCAIFLIALRMKRETDAENIGVLKALMDVTGHVTAAAEEVVDIADPYDGFTRGLPAAPFLPAVLAACGLAAVVHGVERVGPKYGATHGLVLRAAGRPVDLAPESAAARLGAGGAGWTYIDQSQFCPKLYALLPLRALMIKRQVLTTVETLLGPIRGRTHTHHVTGYVHKPYPRKYALLARASGFDSALIVRGVEGGVIPSLRQPGKAHYYHDRGIEQELDTDPTAIAIAQESRAVPLPPALIRDDEQDAGPFDAFAAAQAAAEAGHAALRGAAGPMRDSLIYGGAIILHHLRRAPSMAQAAAAVGRVLDSGKALSHFEA